MPPSSWFPLLLVACTAPSENDDDAPLWQSSDTEADSDTDSDTDADSDADSDTDADPVSTKVAVGDSAACAIYADGTVACDGGAEAPPGSDYVQVRGTDQDQFCFRTPDEITCYQGSTQTLARTGEYSDFDTSRDEACGVRGGKIECWGLTEGLDYLDGYPSGSDWERVFVGFYHACAMAQDGSVGCWGHQVPFDEAEIEGRRFATFATGSHHSCGVAGSGAVDCWTDDESGEFGISAPGGDFSTLDAEYLHYCGLLDDGSIDCFGTYGGDGAAPRAPAGNGFTFVAAGRDGDCAIDNDGDVHCWGQVEGVEL